MQIGSRVFDRDAAHRVDRVEQAGLLDQQHAPLAGESEARADRDALVLLADADRAAAQHLSPAAAAGPRWW